MAFGLRLVRHFFLSFFLSLHHQHSHTAVHICSAAASWLTHHPTYSSLPCPPLQEFVYEANAPAVGSFNLQSFGFELGENTYMKEVVGYRVMREAGVTASNAFHVAVMRNNKFYGLFAIVEEVDNAFLKVGCVWGWGGGGGGDRVMGVPDAMLRLALHCCSGCSLVGARMLQAHQPVCS
jgi:hypothetical protein